MFSTSFPRCVAEKCLTVFGCPGHGHRPNLHTTCSPSRATPDEQRYVMQRDVDSVCLGQVKRDLMDRSYKSCEQIDPFMNLLLNHKTNIGRVLSEPAQG
jgi:hypothetical protein